MDKLNDYGHIAKEYAEKFIDYLPTLLGAIALLLIGLWVIKIIVKYIEKIFQKKDYDPTLEKFTVNAASWGLKILLFVLVITQLGVESASLVAAIGAAGLAIGLALQGSLSNLAGGVLIIVLKPFKVGDWIEAQGVSGSVVEISLFYTKLNTFGNQRAVIPNGELSNDNIVNYSFNDTRRENLTFGISYDDDIKKAKEVLTNMVMERDDIEKEPAPQIIVSELGDSSVNFSVRYFAKNSVFWDIHWYMIEEGKIRLEEAGMTIPYPQRDVYLYDQTKMKGTIRDKRSE
ncbi:MAG: mechanosensitive ion channel family protein [Bacteroidota bacterium]|uniref:Potassium efflux system KefA protein n=1 Tax=Christiangramia flava JLT2011 TaxID=1229726 RepID=A0A1L7I655_9FLAO|nr:mechanosensitive ion channel family protein [Christiangramia flava]APU68714.1 Potassium efflux system KefA protein [Christiangramia flava JLT2011]MAM18785.1 mechanosensitive ion channel family protein [Christiangramia sp.]MEE2772005.1 mechanosensitive ion channel family protein [Bacteroidota bacterium]OSS38239.1 Potassium efflux system KefA protein / Small-conductance mechanosensitive channel [Christiangramia flava JLT2011]